MNKKDFLVYEQSKQSVVDLEHAISIVSDIVNKMSNRQADITFGQIVGKLSAYRLTGDNAVLEGIVADITSIMQMLANSHATMGVQPVKCDIYESATEKPSDLIYFVTSQNGWVDKKLLLDGYFRFLVERQVVTSVAVARCYKSYINSYLEECNLVNNEGMVRLDELQINLQSFVSGKIQGYDNQQKRIRNARSAAKKMLEFFDLALGK